MGGRAQVGHGRQSRLRQQCDRSANDPRQYLGIAVPQPELEKIDLLPVGNRSVDSRRLHHILHAIMIRITAVIGKDETNAR